jgi:WD40 repeat protein
VREKTARYVLIVSHTDLSVYCPETDELSVYRSETGDRMPVYGEKLILGFELAPDDSWVATIEEDHVQVHVWDLQTGAHLAVLAGHTGDIHRIDVLADGSALVTVARDHTVRMWDSHTWQCTQVLRHWEYIHNMSISADGRWIATAANENRVRIWNTSTGSVEAEMWLDSTVRDLS